MSKQDGMDKADQVAAPPLRSTRYERVVFIAAAFVAAGFVGWGYETCIGLAERGTFDWDHGGIGIPFLQIYGIGAALIELVFGGPSPLRSRPVLCVLGICALTAALEYAAGAIMLYGLGVQTWDYRMPGWDFLCTPDGLLSLRGVASFAVMGVLLVYPIDAGLRRLRARWPRAFDTVTWVLVAVICAAMIWSYTAAGTGAFK